MIARTTRRARRVEGAIVLRAQAHECGAPCRHERRGAHLRRSKRARIERQGVGCGDQRFRDQRTRHLAQSRSHSCSIHNPVRFRSANNRCHPAFISETEPTSFLANDRTRGGIPTRDQVPLDTRASAAFGSANAKAQAVSCSSHTKDWSDWRASESCGDRLRRRTGTERANRLDRGQSERTESDPGGDAVSDERFSRAHVEKLRGGSDCGVGAHRSRKPVQPDVGNKQRRPNGEIVLLGFLSHAAT